MVFSSGVYLMLFLPITLVVYYNPLLKNRTFKNLWLLLTSLFFYAWGEPKFVVVLMLSILVNWALAIGMEKSSLKFLKNSIFVCLLLLDIGILFIFKYLNFVLENINNVLNSNIVISKIILPVGISFYTFQVISYVIDVYRGTVKASSSLLNVALYVSMFPQLIAGPIVRYSTIYNEICFRAENINDFVYGIRRFVIGLGKKAILADYLAKIADELFFMTNTMGGLTVLTAWIGAIAYSLQIYFDFSGYSDMAIGIGRCLGFHFEENFNYPYLANSVSDFWKRWHISLTNWFRDYIYIPLGGNRCSWQRHIINLFIVWLLTEDD